MRCLRAARVSFHRYEEGSSEEHLVTPTCVFPPRTPTCSALAGNVFHSPNIRLLLYPPGRYRKLSSKLSLRSYQKIRASVSPGVYSLVSPRPGLARYMSQMRLAPQTCFFICLFSHGPSLPSLRLRTSLRLSSLDAMKCPALSPTLDIMTLALSPRIPFKA